MCASIVRVDDGISDFDRGLELLNHHLHHRLGGNRHSNIVKELIEINDHIEEKKHELEVTKSRWNKARKVSGALTVGSGVGELTAVCIDQLLISDERDAVYWTKVAFLIGIAVTGIFFMTITGVFHCLFERRYKEQKRYMNQISPDDKAMIMKIKKVICSIGMLDSNKNNPNIPLEHTIQECFHCINELEETPIHNRPVPNKSDLVATVIDALPDQHPIKQKIKEIEQAEEEEPSTPPSLSPATTLCDGSGQGFKDLGQRSRPLITVSRHASDELKQHWREITQMLGSIYMPELFSSEKRLKNPLLQNPYAVVVDLDVD